MPLAASTRLGRYEIVDLLGSGGMGEVYRARDPQLDREVAIKVIQTEGAPSPERLRRFEIEARAVAQLSHPNVLSVFDVGACEGVAFVVFELLQGETLRQALACGPLSPRRAVDVAVQACRGLQAAHARGIVHRDLKPENLLLTSDGWVKILDFGLAKLTRGDGAAPSELRTETQDGVILGTLGYLSPEQAGGREADARSDLFALGAILYEALSGRRAFARATRDETLSAILHDDPPAMTLVPDPLGAPVERIVRRCLEKEPERRFLSAHDLALALEAVLERPGGTPASVGDADARSPYPGLASFTEADAARFFGRESELPALWEKLRRRRLLAVIGPSGAGKTSFLRAGVVATRPNGWRTIVATPGATPFLMLAQALAPELSAEVATVQQLLRFEDVDAALSSLSRWRQAHAGALLVVDQFEELFTLNPPEVQSRFATLLGRVSSEADIRVLLSMRDDFLMRCHEHPALSPIFADLTPLGPLSEDGKRRALVEPARAEGYRFEDEGLVEKMLAAVAGERGALPLLAFAVSRLWEMRDRDHRRLTRTAYAEIGGVSGALAQHAEATLERIGADRERMVREVFRNLVTAQGTRATAEREELLSVFEDRLAAEEVLRNLVDARLLTSYEMPGGEGQPDRHRIEIVHESLLQAWPRLVRWEAQDAEGALLRDQLKQTAHLWEEKGRPADLLWTGTSFREYELWRERYPGALTALEEEFAKAMVERTRRRRRLRRAAVAAAFAVVCAVATTIAVLRHRAENARDRAEEETRRAKASELVTLGKLAQEVDPAVALAYARKSLETQDTAGARRFVMDVLSKGPVARTLPLPGENIHATPSPDGQLIACSGWDNVIQLFGQDGKARGVLSRNRNAARIREVRFSDDSRSLATWAPGDPETVVWSVEGDEMGRLKPGGFPRRYSGEELQRFVVTDRGMAIDVRQVTGGALRRMVQWDARDGDLRDVDALLQRVVYSKGRSVYVRPLEHGRGAARDVRLGEHPSNVADAELTDGTGDIVSVDEKREVRVWSGRTYGLVGVRQGLDPDRLFAAPRLSRQGTYLAWQSLRERAFVVWGLGGPPDAGPLLLRTRAVAMGSAEFLPDGRWLAGATTNGVEFWPLGMPWPRVLRGHASGLVGVGFSPDSRWLVSCGTDGARVWPLTPEAGHAHPIRFDSAYTCYGIAMDPTDGQVLVAATAAAAFLARLDDSGSRTLVRVPPRESIRAVALDAKGRWAATAAVFAAETKDRLIHIADRHSGEVRSYPLPGAEADAGLVEAALPHPAARGATGEAGRAHQPASRAVGGFAGPVQDRDRPLPGVEGRADLVSSSRIGSWRRYRR